MDFAYIASQTFGDRDLERELLSLFVTQAQALIPKLPSADAQEQDEKTHLLKGSARAIGALEVAAALEAYQNGSSSEREAAGVLFRDLESAFETTRAAIADRIA